MPQSLRMRLWSRLLHWLRQCLQLTFLGRLSLRLAAYAMHPVSVSVSFSVPVSFTLALAIGSMIVEWVLLLM